MSNVLPFKPKPTTDEYFGGCPHCGQNDGSMGYSPFQRWVILAGNWCSASYADQKGGGDPALCFFRISKTVINESLC